MTSELTRADGYPLMLIPRERLHRLHFRFQHRLPMWVVYRPTTREYLGFWVARMHITLPEPKPTRFVLAHESLRGLRNILPPGLARMDRDPDDVAEIVEIWL